MIRRKSNALSRSNQQLVLWLALTHLRMLWIKDGKPVAATWKPLQAGWMRNGELLEPRYISQALGEGLREIGHRGSSDLVWLLPPELMFLRVGDAPSLEGEMLQKALALEAERIPPDRNEEVVLRVGLQPGVGGRRQAILGKLFRPTFEVLRKIAAEHQLQLWDVDQAGQATGIRLGAQINDIKGLWAVLLLEPGNSSLSVFWNQELVRSRNLVDLLDPWARQTGDEFDLLQVVERGSPTLDSSEVISRINHAIEETLARIAQDGFSAEITKAAHDQDIKKLYITGLGALVPSLNDALVETYSYLFHIERFEVSDDLGALYGPLLAVLDGQKVSRFTLNDQRWAAIDRYRPALTAALAVAGAISLGAALYSFMLSGQIAATEQQVQALKPEAERQKALQATTKALESKLAALEELSPVDWRAELSPLISRLPGNGNNLGVGISRLGVLNSKEQYQYSLEGVAISRFALESFVRTWEGLHKGSITLGRWGKKGGIYEFSATVRLPREVGGE